MKIRNAKKIDAWMIYLLIKHEKDIVKRDVEEIRKHFRRFIIAEIDEWAVGCCSFENYSPKIAEIRSLCVDEEYRNKNIGKRLIKEALKRAKKNQEVFVVTTEKSFFNKLGFGFSKGGKYIMFKYK